MTALLPIVFYLFVAIVCIHILYHIVVFSAIDYTHKKETSSRPPVSLIVYIENNQEDLNRFLPALQNQSYGIFEIILVNNASYDDSLEICKRFAEHHSPCRIVNVENNESFWGNKRYALTLGIKVAKYDHLLFCEPTAIPDSALWIQDMSARFTTSKALVLGHQRIIPIKKSFWNKLMRFQNAYNAAVNFAWCSIGKPLYGNNKNLAYKKEEFYKVNGFIDHMNLDRGEDFYFINTIANRKNSTASLPKTSFTATYTKPSFSNWTQNLQTHIRLFSKLGFWSKWKVRLYTYTKIPYFILLVFLAASLYQWEFLLGLFLLRSLVVISFSHKYLKHFQEKDLTLWFPILEFIHTFTVGFIAFKKAILRNKH